MELFIESDKNEKTTMSNVLDELESESKKNRSGTSTVEWTLEMAKAEGLIEDDKDIRDRETWIKGYCSFGTSKDKNATKCKNYLQSEDIKREARQAALLEVQKAKVSASEYEKKLMKRAQEKEMEKQMAEISKTQKRNANVRSYRRVTNVY